jgi:flagellar protein FlaI
MLSKIFSGIKKKIKDEYFSNSNEDILKSIKSKLTEKDYELDLLKSPLTSSFVDYTYILGESFEDINEIVDEAKMVLRFGASNDLLEVNVPNGYKVFESYWVNKPFAKVYILHDDVFNEYIYYLIEPKLKKGEKLVLNEIKEIVKTKILYDQNIDDKDKYKVIENVLRDALDEYNLNVDKILFSKFYYYLIRDFLGFYKLDGIMRDPYVEDISCDGWDVSIFVYHWNYGSIQTNVRMSREVLDSFVVRLAQRCGKHISVSNPMVDATLPDGSRIQMTLGSDVTARGSTFTIRKFKEILITPIDLIRWGTFSAEEMAYLWLSAENGKSVLFVGGTASGKTTSLNAVALFIPLSAKIVTIEDTREIKIPHMNWIPAVTKESFMEGERGKIDMYDLLKSALRQRPEYIIVGEVRGREAQTLFQAMSTGHTTLSTFHADSVEASIHRLEYPPLSVPRSMLASLNIICIQAQTFVGGRRVRRNLGISEIAGIDPVTRNLKTIDVFKWDPSTDTHRLLLNDIWNSQVMSEIMEFKAWSIEDLEKEFELRKRVLETLVNKGISAKEFIRFMKVFHAKPESAIMGVMNEGSV